ncbi:MAG: 50S ribosomal protein L1 [Euryarchaeota archaeon RBG_16_67_27]|nr:MAG: 50S ribosomal protein L1 [Euryarchaeota archaeon RBG_16_67_27]
MAEKRSIDAVKKALEAAKPRGFKESVEIAVNLKDVDLSVPKNRIDDEVVLPKGRGKTVRVCVFASGELALKARAAADLVIQPQEIEEYASDRAKARRLASEYDFFVAEAPLMPVIGKRLGIVLGPRGRMPRPVPPTSDPTNMINAMRNTVRVRSKDRRTFHAPIGTRDMAAEDIAENLDFLMRRLMGKLERGRFNIQSAFVKTTMGPAVRYL